MIDAVRHLLTAYPQGAFVEVAEKTIHLLVLGPLRSPNTTISDDLSPSSSTDDDEIVVEQVSNNTEAIRITIRLQVDDVDEAPNDFGNDSTQLKHHSWNPYQRVLQGSDRMVCTRFFLSLLSLPHSCDLSCRKSSAAMPSPWHRSRLYCELSPPSFE